jgi:hypothetical protein
MSEDLLNSVEKMDWSEPSENTWKIHYDPNKNGEIRQVGVAGQTNSELPFIIIEEHIAKEFVSGKRYQREFHVKDGALEVKPVDMTVHEVSNKKVGQVLVGDEIIPGTYFITVKGDPDLVIDTISVTTANLDSESQRIKEYLQHNDCYKDQ